MIRVGFFIASCLVISSARLCAEEIAVRGEIVIIQGDSGTEEFGEQFSAWSRRWVAAAESGGFRHWVIIPGTDRQPQEPIVKEKLQELAVENILPLWIVLIGHGTFDGKSAKFNLVGPDISSREFAAAMDSARRPIVFINCSSASAPFIEDLSHPDRILITSTRSGDQVSFSYFGDYLSRAITDLPADLDKDGQVSLLEAFLSASRQVQDFYDADGRVATENALLDDNGDDLGTRASAFKGLRPVAETAKAGTILDGFRAHQLHLVANDVDRMLSPEIIAQRNEIEAEIEKLRLRKADIPQDQYYEQLEELFLKLAGLLLPDTLEDSGNIPNPPAE